MLAQIFDRTQDDKNVCGYFYNIGQNSSGK